MLLTPIKAGNRVSGEGSRGGVHNCCARTKSTVQKRTRTGMLAVGRISYFFFFLGLCWAHVSHKNIRLPYSASIWLPNSGLRFSRVWFTSSSLERVLPSRASSGSLSAERAPARRALSEMDPRAALKGGSANEPLTVRWLPCGLPFLVRGQCLAGWGLFLACFSVLGLDWGFLGLGRSPGRALENWLGGRVSGSGLILGCFLESGDEDARTGS